MTTAIMLDIFSGRNNPTWLLSGEEEKELNDRLASLTSVTHQRPSGVVGGLGYRGFVVTRQNSAFSAEGQIRIHEGVVDRGVALPNLLDNSIEKFILGTFPGELQVQVRDYLVSRFDMPLKFSPSSNGLTCPQCRAMDAPAYNPGTWNNPAVQPYNNCYNYANDQVTNTFAQPGRAHGITLTAMDCAHVQPGAIADGLTACPNFTKALAVGAGWYVALVIWPGADYHWFRQDKLGCWSHKPGQTAARNVDNKGNAISDPKTCDRGPYTVFCSYMVTKRGITVS